MAYVEHDIELGAHPKLLRMAVSLAPHLNLPADCSVDLPVIAEGLVTRLWCWAMKYADGGDLSPYERIEVALGIGWKGDPDALFAALMGARFIEKDGVTIHDWEDYAGKLVHRRQRNAQRMREARAEHGQGTCDARASHVQDTCPASRPNGPEQTRPYSSSETKVPVPPKVSSPTASDWTKRADQILAATAFPLDYQRLAELLAGENKSGKVQVSRVVRGLYEPLLELEQDVDLSADAMRHGLRAAITAGAPNANYVAKAARGYVPGNGKPAGGSSYGALGELYREAQAEADIIDLSPEEHR